MNRSGCRIPQCTELPATIVASAVTPSGAVDLTIEIGAEQWELVDLAMLFNLEWNRRNAGKVSGEQSVQIELRLQGELADRLRDLADGGDIAEALAGLASDDPLMNTEAWFGLTVTEAIPLPPELEGQGEVRRGFTTIWREN